ncbi:YhbD family protein [Gorillibacterium massiliense]|uniref:YhbD family protein n=1 Tax=Gorillibacterium massiliense TaxID=1280390 RepID=UPI0004BBDFC8|nr:YhbD family protein [Gorillibacterium massiliense]
MEEDIISKKDLLELTGISYGQLYRWKRKNLIPEEWFIRKSTFTGQETFFPKRKILARLDRIVNMKDDLSLDELADVFSPNSAELVLGKDDLVRRNLVSQSGAEFFAELAGQSDSYTFEQMLILYILDGLLRSGDINREEGRMIVQVLQDHTFKLKDGNGELWVLRKMGISGAILTSQPDAVFLDEQYRIASKVRIGDKREELKIKLGS